MVIQKHCMCTYCNAIIWWVLLKTGYAFVRVCYSEHVPSFGMFFSFFSKRRNIEVLALDGNRGMNISGLFVGMDKLRNLTLKFCYINTVFKFNSPTLLSSVQIRELITFPLLQLESCFFAYMQLESEIMLLWLFVLIMIVKS